MELLMLRLLFVVAVVGDGKKIGSGSDFILQRRAAFFLLANLSSLTQH